MAATLENLPTTPGRHPFDYDDHDVFTSDPQPDSATQSYQHRFSSRFDLDPLDPSSTSSPSQVKRTIEAHLQETDRRLLDTQKLGTSLLKQREDLTSRLEEVEQYQDEAQVPGELRRRLADIEREHADVGREVARALIGPKSKQDDLPPTDSGVFTSQATGSPTKISAPSRRHRNQPSTRAGDLQFAADISTSLLAQVRQLQAAVVERDDTIKRFHDERDVADRDLHAYTLKVRALDESEQKYKDENWNLETQKHDLLTAARDSQDKEKRLNATLAATLVEKNRLQSELEETNSAHSKLTEEHSATRKAHDTEIHGLKRIADVADSERQGLHDRIEELGAQNQELAKAIATQSRSRQVNVEDEQLGPYVQEAQNSDSPEESPPASPTKATPRHGALESETLRSSLHHAHRMIQNLKGNIHREKTEKIELKRMLQEARDDLEQRRGGESGSGVKRQKTKPDVFKKPARPDMLGGSRRPRTDVEMTDDDWEDHHNEFQSQPRPYPVFVPAGGDAERLTDLSDAYQTANDTEGTFDTADERNTTESEAFMTGAESLAGDSTDELTETEDTASKTSRVAPRRIGRASLAARTPGDRASYHSTASTSADEADDMQTPVQPLFAKFKTRSGRSSYGKQSMLAQQSTPDSFRSPSISEDSPATVMTGESPAAGEQSLFAELGGMDEIDSETQSLQSTPARSSTLSSQHSTPGVLDTPSKAAAPQQRAVQVVTIDSSTMTEASSPKHTLTSSELDAHNDGIERGNQPMDASPGKALLPSAFPLPPSVPTSPVRKIDTSTQYTPRHGLAESPIRPGSSYITPPKTIWDGEHEQISAFGQEQEARMQTESVQSLSFSDVLSQESPPLNASVDTRAVLQRDLEASQKELLLLRTSFDRNQAHLETLQKSHAEERAVLERQISDHGRAMNNLQVALIALESEKSKQVLGHSQKLSSLQDALTISESERSRQVLDHGQELGSLQNSLRVFEIEKTRQISDYQQRISELQSNLKVLQDERSAQIVHHDQELISLHNALKATEDDKSRQILDREQSASEFQSALKLSEDKHMALVLVHGQEVNSLRRALEASEKEKSKHAEDHAKKIGSLQEAIRASEEEKSKTVLDHGIQMTKLQSAFKASESDHSRQIFDHTQKIDSLQESLRALEEEKLKNISDHDTQITGLQGAFKTFESDYSRQIFNHTQNIDGLKEALRASEDEKLKNISDHGTQITSLQSALQASESEQSRQIFDYAQKTSSLEAALRAAESERSRQAFSYDQQISSLKGALESARSEQSSQLLNHDQKINSLENLLRAAEGENVRQMSDHDQKVKTLEGTFKSSEDEHSRQISDHMQKITTFEAALQAAESEQSRQKLHSDQEISGLRGALKASENEKSRQNLNHDRDISDLQKALQILENEKLKQVHGYSQEINGLQGALKASENDKSIKGEEVKRLLSALRRYEDQLALLATSAYSPIMSQETHPTFAPMMQPSGPLHSLGMTRSYSLEAPSTPERPRTAERVIDSRLISAATTLDSPVSYDNKASLGRGIEMREAVPVQDQMADHTTSRHGNIPVDADQDFTQRNRDSFLPELVKASTRHEGSQTTLTAEQIEEALKSRKTLAAPISIPPRTRSPSARSPTRYPGRPSSRNRDVVPIVEDATGPMPPSPTRRPGSASSNRTSSLMSQNYPPLPSDHKDIIAKANTQMESPTRREGSTLRIGGIMGPPTMPASAMRRPRTPNESVRSPTPQQGTARKRGALGSQASRRSSVSSFASELDERFNIRPDQQAATHGFQAGLGTDPRMIQAITQTMIGEFLWKYTRKAGSKEMSTTRHRRYFWVHPYTKTLYWSEQDPQTAGRSEIKAKSVAIESVRVVGDDNPMPPGLHRKSLEVTTPGRKVKFTASTGQRHETWFNALSYLLHRGEDQDTYVSGGNDITPADIAEFNVNGYGARLVPNDSRMSMSSYNSRTTRGTVSNRASQVARQSASAGTVLGSSSQGGQAPGNADTIRRSRAEHSQAADRDRTVRGSSVSKIGRMFGSVTGKTRPSEAGDMMHASTQNRANAGEMNSIYNASVVSDGRHEEEEEARRVQAREQNPGLEDVRACCDGKHNVSSLPHRHISNSTTQNRISNAINRSMSRRA